MLSSMESENISTSRAEHKLGQTHLFVLDRKIVPMALVALGDRGRLSLDNPHQS